MAYSNDLRKRVVEAVFQGGMSGNAAAERFEVSIASAVRWAQRFVNTGEFSPAPTGGDRRRAPNASPPAGLTITRRRRSSSSPNGRATAKPHPSSATTGCSKSSPSASSSAPAPASPPTWPTRRACSAFRSGVSGTTARKRRFLSTDHSTRHGRNARVSIAHPARRANYDSAQGSFPNPSHGPGVRARQRGLRALSMRTTEWW